VKGAATRPARASSTFERKAAKLAAIVHRKAAKTKHFTLRLFFAYPFFYTFLAIVNLAQGIVSQQRAPQKLRRRPLKCRHPGMSLGLPLG
jgi:hypothetical protein